MVRLLLGLLTVGLLASLVILGARGTVAQSGIPDQASQGAQVFAQRCKPCHGDVGQGLAKWRLTWAPEDQNCTQSKCHALNHPPDGFYMPVDAPPIIGENTLSRFTTARELDEYISKKMPFDKPGELSDQQYWAVTAFLLRENGVMPKGVRIDSNNAGTLLLKPVVAPEISPVLVAGVLIALILLGIFLGHWQWRRS
jgi:mono/diheme cytochrome c family protein